MKPWIRKAHRWLGLAFSITILMSSRSGVIHTIMTRTQAPPPTARPSGGGLDLGAIRISAAEASSLIPEKTPVTPTNLRSIEIFRVLPVYRFDADDGVGTRVYVSTITGSVPVTPRTKNKQKRIYSRWFISLDSSQTKM